MLNIENIRITPQILNLIAEIESFSGEWKALENHTTSLQLLGDVATFGQKFKAVIGPWQHKPIDEDVVKLLHGVITGAKEQGVYRSESFPLVIQKGTKILGALETSAPEDIDLLMGKLMPWVQNALEEKKFHPILVIALFMAIFLQISPFEKGNHRLARLLMTLLMFKAGYQYAPYSSLDHVVNGRMDDYYDVLRHTQDTVETGVPDWEPWLLFILFALKEHKDVLARRIESGGEQLAEMPELSTKVLALFEDHKRLSMKEIISLTKGRRSTLKLRLGELVKDGYLKRHGYARATWYAKV